MRLKRKIKNTIYIASTLVFGWVITVSGISAMKHLNRLDAIEFRVNGETRFTLPALASSINWEYVTWFWSLGLSNCLKTVKSTKPTMSHTPIF